MVFTPPFPAPNSQVIQELRPEEPGSAAHQPKEISQGSVPMQRSQSIEMPDAKLAKISPAGSSNKALIHFSEMPHETQPRVGRAHLISTRPIDGARGPGSVDPHSYADLSQGVTHHVDLTASVDF